MEATPAHANPMGTIHGGMLCDIGDAALSTAYMSTLEADQMFATVDLLIHFLKPVRTERLEAVDDVGVGARGTVQCAVAVPEPQ